jgi:amino acid transporter
MYASYATLLAWSAGNSIVFGEYVLLAGSIEPTQRTIRSLSFICLTVTALLHGGALKWGLRLQNILGTIKIFVLLAVISTGFFALGGNLQVERPHNFSNMFKGTRLNLSSICLGLYSVIWSYAGYHNVNYALSEVKNPNRTVRIAGSLAVAITAISCLLANIAYFAAASREDIIKSNRLIAALLFRNVYGPRAERVMSLFVALSAFGTVLSVMFSQGRAVQELGSEGILPFSNFLASSRPFNAPSTGMFLTWLINIVIIFALTPGDAFQFSLQMTSYCFALINTVVPLGLVYLTYHPYPNWPKLNRQTVFAAAAFGSANVFLSVVPLIKPPPGSEPYETLPYWSHALGGWALFSIGFLYWTVWAVLLPRYGSYKFESVIIEGEDGSQQHVLKRIDL